MFLLTYSVLLFYAATASAKSEAWFDIQDTKADDRQWRFFYLFIRNLMAILFYGWPFVGGLRPPVPLYRYVNPHTCRPPVQAI